ncbi:MAG: pectate lyase, partial [Bacteroidaceae bacterium]|nr:pectate lyase [Bacteroidaceae bacterium]
MLHSSFFTLHLNAQAPAFPGAEGHARYITTGGRGGNVYHVTTLADDKNGNTTGSLRWCLKQAAPR